MAARSPTVTVDDQGAVTGTWEQIEEADTTNAMYVGNLSDKSIQVFGTFDGATITVQGSNDGTNFAGFATAVTFTAAGVKTLPEYCRFIKLTTAAGGATSDVDAVLSGLRRK